MNMTLKITGTLADPTRYSIYEYILKKSSEITVQDVASEFGIHPNVARLHLTKLEDVELIYSFLHKTGKGGRPGKVYKAAEKAIQLSFPHRDYQLLSNVLLDAVYVLGEEGVKRAEAAAEKAGQRAVDAEGRLAPQHLTYEEKAHLLNELAARVGYVPKVVEENGKVIVEFVIYNCPFKELLTDQAELTCRIHKAFLTGVLASLFGDMLLDQKTAMTDGCKECAYQAIVTN